MDSSPPTGTLSAAPTPPRSEGSDSSNEEGIICEETLAVTGPYSIRITLGKHEDYDSMVTIGVTILHGGHHGQTVGYLTGCVIDRDLRPRWNFHEVCEDLEEVAVEFCDGDGTLRYKDLDGLSADSDSASSRGGFLHIERVAINEGHRRRDLGLASMKTLLEWLNVRDAREREEHWQAWMTTRKSECTYLHAGWTIAVLQPGVGCTEEDHERLLAAALSEVGVTEEERAMQRKV